MKRLQTLQHVFAALTLALTARQHLQHAHDVVRELPAEELPPGEE